MTAKKQRGADAVKQPVYREFLYEVRGHEDDEVDFWSFWICFPSEKMKPYMTASNEKFSLTVPGIVEDDGDEFAHLFDKGINGHWDGANQSNERIGYDAHSHVGLDPQQRPQMEDDEEAGATPTPTRIIQTFAPPPLSLVPPINTSPSGLSLLPQPVEHSETRVIAPRPLSLRSSLSLHSPTAGLSPTPTLRLDLPTNHRFSSDGVHEADGPTASHIVVLRPVSSFSTGAVARTRALLPPLIAPYRFGHIEEDLFRGGYPKPRNHRFLRRLRLRTIVSLTPDPPAPDLLEFCGAENIKSLHIPVAKSKGSIPLGYARVSAILQILVNAQRHPMYVHCLDGALVTGSVIMCLRKLQLWTGAAAIAEFARYSGDTVETEQTEFLESFGGEIELPSQGDMERYPPWLWAGGTKIPFQKKHPTLRVRFAQPKTPPAPTGTPNGGVPSADKDYWETLPPDPFNSWVLDPSIPSSALDLRHIPGSDLENTSTTAPAPVLYSPQRAFSSSPHPQTSRTLVSVERSDRELHSNSGQPPRPASIMYRRETSQPPTRRMTATANGDGSVFVGGVAQAVRGVISASSGRHGSSSRGSEADREREREKERDRDRLDPFGARKREILRALTTGQKVVVDDDEADDIIEARDAGVSLVVKGLALEGI
ncbi:hypothetical protein HDU93_007996 [Gonapodya sp. JEL0774]|nr:hypothetical protein HDU93_007996 [Gonapodya sp. JEL0774]